jgi:hypothetical protein
VHEGSFLSGDDIRRACGDRQADAAYMIESFVHAEHPELLFGHMSERLAPGGVLVICDDFPTPGLVDQLSRTGDLRRPAGTAQRINLRLAREFREGWHIRTFRSVPGVLDLAADHGLTAVNVIDLTPFVVTSRPRDLIARVSAPAARAAGLSTSFWQNVTGGSALQRLIRRRRVRYTVLVLRKGKREL